MRVGVGLKRQEKLFKRERKEQFAIKNLLLRIWPFHSRAFTAAQGKVGSGVTMQNETYLHNLFC